MIPTTGRCPESSVVPSMSTCFIDWVKHCERSVLVSLGRKKTREQTSAKASEGCEKCADPGGG